MGLIRGIAKMNSKHNPQIIEDIVPESNKLFITFGGGGGGIIIPPFEFYKSLKIVHENKIFIRDINSSCYQCGLPGLADNIFDLGELINNKITEINPKEVFYFGNSMGGFAAIFFAAYLRRGKAIAFSPQTFISLSKRLKNLDFRWQRPIFDIYKKSFFKKHIYDLEKVFDENNKGFSVEIFVAKNNRLDMIHANYLKKFKNVKINQYDITPDKKYSHCLVYFLRDQGVLENIIKKQVKKD